MIASLAFHRGPAAAAAAYPVPALTPHRAQDGSLALGRNCDAQDIVARWTSSAGANCLGAIKMINTPPSPMGLWFTILSGIWGPEKEFPRYDPLLAEVGQSFAINDQYARRYIASGLENLRRLEQQTAAAIQDLNRAREQNQAAWEARQDYMDSKWDDYRRGNGHRRLLRGPRVQLGELRGAEPAASFGDDAGGQQLRNRARRQAAAVKQL